MVCDNYSSKLCNEMRQSLMLTLPKVNNFDNWQKSWDTCFCLRGIDIASELQFWNFSIKKGVTKLFHHPETIGICLIIACVVSPVLIWSLDVNVTWCCFVRMIITSLIITSLIILRASLHKNNVHWIQENLCRTTLVELVYTKEYIDNLWPHACSSQWNTQNKNKNK